MKLVINAANIHQGGGRTLLLDLLAAVRLPAVAILDARLKLPAPLPPNIQIITVQPTLAARFSVERKLSSLCEDVDVLLCFGNLPPLFSNRAKVLVYLQNRYLASTGSLAGLPQRTRARIHVERIWLRSCLRNATVLVQTPSMAAQVKAAFGRSAMVAPFAPAAGPTGTTRTVAHDFLYVASGEIHKNHRRLIEAWELLASEGYYPSLRLTLDPTRDGELARWIAGRAESCKLKIANAPVPLESIADLYAESATLVYPSLFESYGLPLIEAHAADLGIVAAERDYVRDVIAPAETFDPESALSIARAVKRHMGLEAAVQGVPSADAFLAKILAVH